MLLGKARGSVGDLTFSVLNSEQITRAKAKSVKNPRTDAQMIQRVLMSTTVHAYSGMQEIVDHSFQGVPYQGRSMNRFNQLNVKNLRALYAQIAGGSTDVPLVFNANGNKRISLAPWIMSTGSLPTVGLKIDAEAGSAWPVALTNSQTVGTNTVDAGVAIDASFESAPSYADLIAYFGLQAGDQLTLTALTRLVSDNEPGCSFKYGRFILQPNDGDLSHLLTDASVANEKNQGISFSFSDDTLYINFADLVEAGENNRTQILEAAIITSRLENNAWKRSNSQMVMCTDDLADGGVDMETAIDSYSSVQFDTNSPWYLNKAGRGTTAEQITSFAGYIDQTENCLAVVEDGVKNLVTSTGAIDGKIIIASPDVQRGGTVGEHIDEHDFNESNNITGTSAGFPANFPCISVEDARNFVWIARQISID